MRRVFKRVIVGDEVRYGMEFSLEEPHGLTCPQHTVAHDSTDGTLWEIRRITVAWTQIWMPESELGGARELVDEFKTQLCVRHKNGQGKTDVMSERTAKRRRGRPQSLEDVQQLCAAAYPLHTSSAGSNASFSARPSRRAQPFSACARAENAPSWSKRP